MDPDKLQSTNRLLHDLERKLSLGSTSSSNYTAQSHGSVVQDPKFAGVAKQNIQSSVLRYIKDNTSEFDADGLYADRQQRFATSFAPNYSPKPEEGQDNGTKSSKATSEHSTNSKNASKHNQNGQRREAFNDADSDDSLEFSPRPYGAGTPKTAFKPTTSTPVAGAVSPDTARHFSDSSDYSDDYDTYYGDHSPEHAPLDALELEDLDELDDLDSDLLPPSPPRSPPRDIDPGKLYGLYDFSGPDPSHCTLSRDEPVYLINDSDNYWWLIKKLTKDERAALLSTRELPSDDEDGKIGFVPAECLETYTERLARLNCFKNEELERSGETLPLHLESESAETAENAETAGPGPALGRSGSILKKTRGYRPHNKSVTFENLSELNLEDDDDDILGFQYYSVERDEISPELEDPERHSEVLSDVFPTEVPLNVKKSTRKKNALADFAQPRLLADNDSIGTYSPDTPPPKKVFEDEQDHGDQHLRRSVILDRLNIVTSSLPSEDDTLEEPAFGGCLEDYHATTEDDCGGSESSGYGVYDRRITDRKEFYDSEEEGSLSDYPSRKSLSVDDLNTPVASVNSLTNTVSPTEKRRAKKPVQDMYLPILGKLDELTEKLAELEYLL